MPKIALGGQNFDDDALDDDDDAMFDNDKAGGAKTTKGSSNKDAPTPAPVPATASPTVGDMFGAILTVAPTFVPTPAFVDPKETGDHNKNFCGRTLEAEALDWKKYGSNSIYVDVFTTSCKFEIDNPQYIFELIYPDISVWSTIGTSNLALATNRMFRLVVHRFVHIMRVLSCLLISC
jgi:hypothetical protein